MKAIEKATFEDRLRRFRDDWKKHLHTKYDSMDALAIVPGTGEGRAETLSKWLFGGLAKESIVLILEREVIVLPSASTANAFKTIAGSTVTILDHNSPDEANYGKLLSNVSKSYGGRTVVVVSGTSEHSTPFKEAVVNKGLQVGSFPPRLSTVLAIKDDVEAKHIGTAASISVAVLKNSLLQRIERIVNDEKTAKHADLVKETQALFDNPEKISKKLTTSIVSAAYLPVVQSGKYDFNFGARPDDRNLDFSSPIVCSVAARYKHYCSDVARTYFIDPPAATQTYYDALLAAQESIIKGLRPGAKFSDLYKQAKRVLEEKKPGLSSHFLNTAGSVIGISYSDPDLTISEESEGVFDKGMILSVRVGLTDLKIEGSKPNSNPTAMLIADTIKTSPEISDLTSKCIKVYSEIAYELGPSEESEEKPSKRKRETDDDLDDFTLSRAAQPENVIIRGGRALRNTTLRQAMASGGTAADKARAASQKQIAADLVKRMLERLDNNDDSGSKAKDGKVVEKRKDFLSYKSPNEFPADASREQISIDVNRDTVILPIYGLMVPFHINSIKSVTKTEEYLRILFKVPGTKAIPDSEFKDPLATFVKEATFRIPNVANLNHQFRRITELKKRVSNRETEAKTRASLKEQPDLILNKTGRYPRIPRLFIRPNLTGRKSTGVLEAHTNGFRFTTPKQGHVDVIYDNIRYAFFVPAEKSLIVLLHFYLHSPIMIGKKKSSDVQFYMEVMESSLALDGARSSKWGDAEEIEDEQRDREQIQRLNKEFQNFTKAVEDLVPGITFEMPYANFGFEGVHYRSAVLFTPTVSCLINLTEHPFFVLPLEDVQIAYFERVQHGLRLFDIAFILNDWKQDPIKVTNVPISYLDTIKDWLNDSGIKYYQGSTNLNWRKILNKFAKDPRGFWEDGGYQLLEEDAESEEEEEEESDDKAAAAKPKPAKRKEKNDEIVVDDDEEEGSAEYRPRGGDDDEFHASSSSESESVSESSSGSSEESDSGASSDEDDGEDWDDMEEKLMKSDRQKAQKRLMQGGGYDSDEDRPAKRPRKM